MRLRAVLLIFGRLLAGGQECVSVDGPQVTAGSLREALPDMASIPAGTVFGYTPAPGSIRWWRAPELQALVAKHGGSVANAHDVCVVRSTHNLNYEEVRAAVEAALRSSFPNAESAQVQVLDYSRQPVPTGRIDLNPKQISPSSAGRDGPVLLWRGRFLYDSGRSLPFWVSLTADVARKGWVATRMIEPGEVIRAADILEATWVAPISQPASAVRGEEIVGREARVRIAVGDRISARLVTEPYQIRRGETVAVTLQSGNTRLGFEGRALSSGRAGDFIPIESAASRKLLRGRLSDGKKVVVELENSLEKNYRRLHSESAAAGSNVRTSEPGSGVIQEEESRSVRTGAVRAVR